MPQSLLAGGAEVLPVPSSPALPAPKVGRFWILAPKTSPGPPCPPVPGLLLVLSQLGAACARSPARLEMGAQPGAPGSALQRSSRDHLCKGNHPGGLCRPCAHSAALSCGHRCCGKGFSLLRVCDARGWSWEGTHGSVPLLCSGMNGSAPCLLYSAKTHPNRLHSAFRAAEHVLELDCWRCSSLPGRWSV